MVTYYLYALKDDADRYLYIGRTTDPTRREYEHRGRKGASCGSVDIPKELAWRFVIIDECDEIDVKYLEILYINFFEPIYNRQRPRNIPRPIRWKN